MDNAEQPQGPSSHLKELARAQRDPILESLHRRHPSFTPSKVDEMYRENVDALTRIAAIKTFIAVLASQKTHMALERLEASSKTNES